jgi:hypothetical protein
MVMKCLNMWLLLLRHKPLKKLAANAVTVFGSRLYGPFSKGNARNYFRDAFRIRISGFVIKERSALAVR